MIQEHEIKWLKDTLMQIDHYVPVIWGDKILREGTRRNEKDQHIRLDKLDVEGRSVIDLGCNNGYFCFKLRDKGARFCIGIDISGQMIKAASILQRYNNYNHIRFYISDLYIVDPIKVKSDIALMMSLHPANWEFVKLVKEDESIQKEALDFLSKFADTIYLEPTNHHCQNQKSWTKDIKIAQKHVEALGGSLEFLTWTDYQKRPLMKLIPSK